MVSRYHNILYLRATYEYMLKKEKTIYLNYNIYVFQQKRNSDKLTNNKLL